MIRRMCLEQVCTVINRNLLFFEIRVDLGIVGNQLRIGTDYRQLKQHVRKYMTMMLVK